VKAPIVFMTKIMIKRLSLEHQNSEKKGG